MSEPPSCIDLPGNGRVQVMTYVTERAAFEAADKLKLPGIGWKITTYPIEGRYYWRMNMGTHLHLCHVLSLMPRGPARPAYVAWIEGTNQSHFAAAMVSAPKAVQTTWTKFKKTFDPLHDIYLNVVATEAVAKNNTNQGLT